jgi:hypothetical protein
MPEVPLGSVDCHVKSQGLGGLGILDTDHEHTLDGEVDLKAP